MEREPVALKLGRQGRLVVPAALRRELGLEAGAELVARVESGRLVLEPRSAVVDRLRERFAQLPGSLADELIRERRLDSSGVAVRLIR